MDNIKELLQRYLDDNASARERQQLMKLYHEGKLDDAVIESMMKEIFNEGSEQDMSPESAKEMFARILSHEEQARIIPIRRKWNWVLKVAAAVLVVAGAGVWRMYSVNTLPQQTLMKPVAMNDIVAGADKAVLTLVDGRKIELNGKGGTAIPQQGGAQIVSDSGSLTYQATGSAKEVLFNTITTPRGGQYQLTLADGSKVWLNSVSSLKYPTAFTGRQRVVELTGEAYFEIARNEKMPFKVRIPSGAEIEVLGTHFNVMAYAEEEVIKTTLLEGAVKITGAELSSVTLSPNQQAQITKQGTLTVIKNYDVSEAVAWKNNKFVFKNTGLPEIMRQISRWYDVEVTYRDDVSALRFGGTVSRRENASAVLNLLELTGSVDFEIEGRKIIVKSVKR